MGHEDRGSWDWEETPQQPRPPELNALKSLQAARECGACGRLIPEGGSIHCGLDHAPIVKCDDCRNEIDPEWCHCGDAIKDHRGMSHNHSPVPMGCTCGYASAKAKA